jgi:hypothetical protein
VLAGELALVVELAAGLPPLLLLQAAIVTAAAIAITVMAGFLEPRMRLSSPDDAGISCCRICCCDRPAWGLPESADAHYRRRSAYLLRNI